MKKGKKLISVLLAVAITLNTSYVFAGGWVDDFLQQKTSSGPNYYSGQQRGYATAGGFSARWKTGMDYPISVQPPSFKAGCGGINFFSGSISMLNMDMLVAKLQRILQNSAGIAFNMALETVCPKCASIMNIMESISNQLNGMGMNDCSMAKGLTIGAASLASTTMKEIEAGTLGATVSKGLTDGYGQAKNELTGGAGSNTKAAMDWLNTKMATPPNKDPLKSGCPSMASDMFPDLGDVGAVKSVLQVVGTKLGLPSSHIDLMRGMVGDIEISGADGGYSIIVVPGCSANPLSPDDISSGVVQSMDESGACDYILDDSVDMVQFVSDTMQDVATRMKNKQAIVPDSDIERFIINSPLPIAYALKMGVSSGQEGMVISNLAGITASALTMKSMTELMSRVTSLLQMAAEQNAKVMNPKDLCNVDISAKALEAAQAELGARVQVVTGSIGEQMAAQLSSYTQVINVVQQIENANKMIQASLASKFGASLALRAMR